MLDLKTGYPLPNFSSLVVYSPRLESESFLASAVLAVMGKEKAFGLLSRMKGTAAVWIDGSGKEPVHQRRQRRQVGKVGKVFLPYLTSNSPFALFLRTFPVEVPAVHVYKRRGESLREGKRGTEVEHPVGGTELRAPWRR